MNKDDFNEIIRNNNLLYIIICFCITFTFCFMVKSCNDGDGKELFELKKHIQEEKDKNLKDNEDDSKQTSVP